MKKNISNLAIFVMFFTQISFAQNIKDCSSCSSQIIKTENIKDLSIDEIQFLTNDLFARKGYQFKDAEIDWYFSEKSWYKPTENSKIVYNTIEKQNIQLFQDRTTVLKIKRDKLISELKILKNAIVSNDKRTLSSKYKFESGQQSLEYITESFKKINLDEINFRKNSGNYEVSIDDGKKVILYSILINDNEVSIRFSNQGGTRFGETLYPSGIIIEDVYIWKFEWKNNVLKFIQLFTAG